MEILFNNLSLDILDFQSSFVENLSQLSLDQVSAMDDLDITLFLFLVYLFTCIHNFVTLYMYNYVASYNYGWD